MFVETSAPFPFGTEVIVHLRLPAYKEEFLLPAVVRWTRQDGMGVQFGLLGARETHAITEVVRTAPR
jgi:type IV pilus assembly protein PilZ